MAQFGDDSASDSDSMTLKEIMTKESVSPSDSDNENGTITWKIGINIWSLIQEYGTLQSDGTYTISDTIKVYDYLEGMDLVGGSVYLSAQQYHPSFVGLGSDYTYDLSNYVTVTSDGFYVDITDVVKAYAGTSKYTTEDASVENNQIIYINYTTKVSDYAAYMEAGQQTFSNTANTVVDGEIVSTASDEETLTYKTTLSKTYTYTSGSYATFTIEGISDLVSAYINSEKANGVTWSTVTLVDEYGADLAYSAGQFNLAVTVTDGSSVTAADVTVVPDTTTHTITFTIDADKAMEITSISYQLMILLTVGQSGSSYDLSNTVYLNGYENSSSETKIKESISASGAEVGWEGATLHILKTDAADDSKVLQGATFTVYKAYITDEGTLAYYENQVVTTGTTLASGRISLENLQFDTLYAVVETTAPTGYEANTEPFYVYYYTSDDDATLKTINEKSLDVETKSTDGQPKLSVSRTVKNEEKRTTSITVNKEWLDANSNEIPGTEDVDFDLYYYKEADASSGGSSGGSGTATISFALSSSEYQNNSLAFTSISVPDGVDINISINAGNEYVRAFYVLSNYSTIYNGSNWSDTDLPDSYKTQSYTISSISADYMINYLIYSSGWNTSYDSYGTITVSYTYDGYVYTETYDGTSWTESKEEVTSGGSTTGKRYGSYTLTSSNGYSMTIEDLPGSVVENGTTYYYYYYVEETTSLSGYTTTYSADSENGVNSGTITITNTSNETTPQTTEVSVTKTWVDNSNAYNTRPETTDTTIAFKLYKSVDGAEAVEVTDAAAPEITNNGDDTWTVKWSNLPTNENGKSIAYYVKEITVPTGYASTASTSPVLAANGITNTLDTTTITVTKTWSDADSSNRPDSITVNIYVADDAGKKTGTAVDTLTLYASDDWANVTSKALPKTDKDGNAIKYVVEEDAVSGYTTTIDGYNVTNTLDTGDLTVTKIVAGSVIDIEKEFEFTVELDDDTLNGTFGEMTFVDGVATFNLKHGGSKTATGIPAGTTYTVTEKSYITDGYVTTSNGADGEIVKGMPKTAEFTNTITSVKISKVDIADGEELESATIQILDKDENIIDEWVSTDTPHEVTGLKTGETYTLRETVAPEGYSVTTDTTFTLKADGTIDTDKTTTTVDKDGVLLVEDTITTVKISKVDIADGEELPGATIQIIDKDGKVVEEWVSTDTPHEVTGLKTGETYTLRETVAPDGYSVTTDTTFTLKDDGTLDTDKTTTTVDKDGVLLVEDTITTVKISKVDVTTEEELPGATIQILDKDGNIVDEWVSTDQPHEVTGKLNVGETYTLRETVAPEGYDITTDTTFVLKADGTIDTDKTTTTISEDGVLLVEDQMTQSDEAVISVTKNLALINGDVLIAPNATFYVGLYVDEACTNLYESKAITFENASASTVTFTGLEVGRTYYIAECDEDGNAFDGGVGTLADGTTYMANFGDGAEYTTATVESADSEIYVEFTNEFYGIPDDYYKECTLTITKQLFGADGNALKSDAVFYAGLFTDASLTTLATNVDPYIVALDLAGGSEVTVEMKISIANGETVTLYVAETDADGNPVAGTDGFAYTVGGDGQQVTLDAENATASVTITNTEIEENSEEEAEEEEEESEEEETETETETETESAAVQTGDETPLAMYFSLMLMAAAVMLAGVIRRRRRDGEEE